MLMPVEKCKFGVLRVKLYICVIIIIISLFSDFLRVPERLTVCFLWKGLEWELGRVDTAPRWFRPACWLF